MQTLKRLYRSSYAGENVITRLTYENGEWKPETEMVPNQVFNTYTTTQALAIGNGESRLQFNLGLISTHQGGLYGTNRLQTYGCNALYRDFTPDFLVATGNNGIISEIAESGFANENIVYTNSIHLLEHPGKFYLIPYDPYGDAGYDQYAYDYSSTDFSTIQVSATPNGPVSSLKYFPCRYAIKPVSLLCMTAIGTNSL